MIYEVREATPDELPAVAKSWRTLLTLPRPRADKARGLPAKPAKPLRYGTLSLSRGWLAKALYAYVDELLPRSTVLVADHPAAPGFPLGWVAFELDPPTLHALHVDADSRGKWVGRTLLARALDTLGPSPRLSITTEAGDRLLSHRTETEAAA